MRITPFSCKIIVTIIYNSKAKLSSFINSFPEKRHILWRSIIFKKRYLTLDRILNNFLKRRFLIFIFFLVLLLSLKSSVLNLPAYCDETNYLNGVFKIWENNLNPFIEFWSYKPPLFFMLAALTYKLFGYSILITHFIILLLSFLTLCFTFLLAEEIYNRTIALFATLLLFFSPFFFAQSILFYADNLVATLTIITIYFFLKNNKCGYFISATLLVLTKEPAILPIPEPISKILLPR